MAIFPIPSGPAQQHHADGLTDETATIQAHGGRIPADGVFSSFENDAEEETPAPRVLEAKMWGKCFVGWNFGEELGKKIAVGGRGAEIRHTGVVAEEE